MTYVSPSSDDLSLLLGAAVDDDRAEFIIGLAEKACRAVVSPLPDDADAVVISVAARVYGNPQAVSQEALGPYSVGRPVGLTKQERSALRHAGGRAGAFTIDPTPANVSASNVWAQIPMDPSQPYDSPPYTSDFDQVP